MDWLGRIVFVSVLAQTCWLAYREVLVRCLRRENRRLKADLRYWESQVVWYQEMLARDDIDEHAQRQAEWADLESAIGL